MKVRWVVCILLGWEETEWLYVLMVCRDVELVWEEVAEYGGDSSSSSVEEAVAAFDKGLGAAESVAKSVERSEQPAVSAARVVIKPKKSPKTKVEEKAVSAESSVDEGDSTGGKRADVLLLQGPCSFVRVSGRVEMWREELQRQIQQQADKLKIVVKGRNYDSEKIILQMLLEAREEQVVVLCWDSKFERLRGLQSYRVSLLMLC